MAERSIVEREQEGREERYWGLNSNKIIFHAFIIMSK